MLYFLWTSSVAAYILVSLALFVLLLILLFHCGYNCKIPNLVSKIRKKNANTDGYIDIEAEDNEADAELFLAAEEREK